MSHASPLWLYFVLVFGIVILPGMDMAFVLASALTGGRRAGAAAVAGIIAGGAAHVIMSTLGIAALLAVVPAAFDALLVAGAAYMAWIGVAIARGGVMLPDAPGAARRTSVETFRRGALTCLMNPKAYVFMLAVFPQFLRPGRGPLAWQAAQLGAMGAFCQALVYGAVALAAGRVRPWLAGNRGAGLVAARAVGGLLVAMAAFTIAAGWRR